MSPIKQYETYQNNAVNTASKGQLTLMLYNGCIKFIKQAMKDLEEKDFEGKNKHIQKAQDIIQELMLTLDQKAEISSQLLPLYEYMNYRLQEANIQNDSMALEEVLEFVSDFRNTWKEVMKKAAPQKYAQGAQV
ncbi:flagellar export chaperone FliS [Virgibacillus sp. W0181]|uniref:flagellar export chaperone FliS n=1 Tax=Virgibacillus sp. W0181 TaxID=3391581 RepID=UPI003F452C65